MFNSDMFPAEQLYIVFEFADAGTDLENFKVKFIVLKHHFLLEISSMKIYLII